MTTPQKKTGVRRAGNVPGTCPKCGSADMLNGLHILDRDESTERDLSIRVEKEPGSIIFRDYKDFRFIANICSGCGFTELYVENPQALAATLRGRPTP